MAAAAQFVIGLLDQANHLKQLPRTGWLLAGVSDPESVAEHSFSTALLSMVLAEAVNDDWREQGLAAPLSVDRVVRLALIHDLAESMLTDLPRRSSELLGREVKHSAEARAMALILGGIPNSLAYQQLWAEYDADSSPEAHLVRDADKLEMAHQATCYARRGHTKLQEFWQGHEWHYPFCRLLFEGLLIGGS